MAFKEEVDISEKSRRTDTEPCKEEGKSEKTFIIHVPIAINVIVSGSRFKAKHSLDSDEEDEKSETSSDISTTSADKMKELIADGWCSSPSQNEYIGLRVRRFFPNYGISDASIVS